MNLPCGKLKHYWILVYALESMHRKCLVIWNKRVELVRSLTETTTKTRLRSEEITLADVVYTLWMYSKLTLHGLGNKNILVFPVGFVLFHSCALNFTYFGDVSTVQNMSGRLSFLCEPQNSAFLLNSKSPSRVHFLVGLQQQRYSLPVNSCPSRINLPDYNALKSRSIAIKSWQFERLTLPEIQQHWSRVKRLSS